MKQHFNKYSHELAYKAISECFDRKWNRRDLLRFIEEYAGISRYEIFQDTLNDSCWVKMEATDAIAYFLDELVDTICNDEEPDCVDPVVVHERADGMTNKMRQIANLCYPHQLLGHIAKLGLEPLLKARIYPTQHASIPGRGQTKLKNQIAWYLRKQSLNINYFVKTDVHHAYASLKYADCIRFIKREIPKATWILKILAYLEKLAPDGHLIIGGYLDAWLFNLMMSYALRDVMTQGNYRRGVFHRYVVRVVTYMDDFCILTETRTAARKAFQKLAQWFSANLKLSIRQTSSVTELYSMQDERRAKGKIKLAQRGCPGIDMGGFEIHRTYTTIRPRVSKRVLRSFDRGWQEMQETGTLQRQRAKVVISRFGYVKQTTSKYLRRAHHIDEVLNMAKRVTSFWSRKNRRETKEWLNYVVTQYQSRLASCECCN